MKSFFWYPTWNSLKQDEGLEHLLLDDFSAVGRISAYDKSGESFSCTYEIRWDGNWSTREIHIQASTSSFTRRLSLYSEKDGLWRNSHGHQMEAFNGCLDVDIWPSPFTNTLPIRRLGLKQGERQKIKVIYISAPELEVKTAHQAYTRLEKRLYLYEGLDTGYKNELPVDEQDLVLDYPGVFRRYGWKDN